MSLKETSYMNTLCISNLHIEIAASKSRKEVKTSLDNMVSLTMDYTNDMLKAAKALKSYLDKEGISNSEKKQVASSINEIEKSLKALDKQLDKVADTSFNTHRIDL